MKGNGKGDAPAVNAQSSSPSRRHEKESTRRKDDERRRRHSSSSPGSSRSRSRSAPRSKRDGSKRGDSHRPSRHHRHRSSQHRSHHHESSSRRRRSRSREHHHSRRAHSRSRSNSRDRHREKSHRPSRRDSRAESGSSRRKYSNDRKQCDGDRHRAGSSSHRKRSRDEKEGDAAHSGAGGKRAKEVEADQEKEKASEEKSEAQSAVPIATSEATSEVQKENAPLQEKISLPQVVSNLSQATSELANGTENSGSTSPVGENSSQSSTQSKANGVAVVDPLAVASTAKKMIEEAKAALLKNQIKPAPAPPAAAVDMSSIKMDILKALAEARSTIAEIKGSDSVVKEKPGAPVEAVSTENPTQPQEEMSTRRSKSQSPKKKIKSESASTTETAVDEFDMFSMAELDDVEMSTAGPGVSAPTVSEVNLQSNCDDAEGYYNTTVGEVLNNTYRVLGVVGKGVFSTVLRCARIAASKENELDVVAIKLIRNNEIMRDAAQTEVNLLKELSERDPRDKKHCVRLLDTFEHRNHVALVFESMQMNVREAMKKFGGKGGISIQAVRVFSKHLLIALNHLEACAIVHADIKPDNILLDDKQTTIKLCDFGSAFKVDEGKQDPTPYLVSRFYRAPEIVLGLAYDKSVDMWSIGCCLYEMFTGKVMFPGSTNNEMLKLFMELKGKIPNKLIKKHRQAYIEQFEMEPHFTEDLKFCSRESDRVTGKPILRLMDNVKAKNDLGSSLMAAKSSTDDRKLVLELRNLLERMFTLDPAKRISVREALAHPFVKTS
ncbi:Cmgc/dyrk/prp4 protein kinase [Globisporangium polare]